MAYSLTYSYDSTSQSYSVTGWSDITTSDKVVIPDKYNDGTNGEHPVTSIGNGAFDGCGYLTSVTIGSGVTSIDSYAFSGCSSLTSVYITDIAAWCKISFSNTYSNPLYYAHNLYLNNELVTELTIPDSVTSIGSVAFVYCSSLTSVTIPDGVTSIGSYAFSRCTNLKQLILLPSTPPTLGSSAIPSTISKIYVPKSSKAAYQTNWTAFASKIVWDNIYTSFVRFNQKNKEYINGKVDELSIKVAPILSDYVDDTLLGG